MQEAFIIVPKGKLKHTLNESTLIYFSKTLCTLLYIK